MASPARIVFHSTREDSKGSQLPAPLSRIVTAFTYIRRAWRWIRLGNIYKNPNNFLKLAMGHGLNLACGDALLVRIAAVSVLIATRILECVEQQAKLQRSVDDLKRAFRNEFPTPIHVKWVTKGASRFLSPSTVYWWKYHMKQLWERIKRIALCIFRLLKEAFILGMRICDAIESFALTPETQHEAVNLLFVNSHKWVEKLVDNKQVLIEGLASNKKSIDRILTSIHSPLSATQLIDGVTSALNTTEKIHHAVDTASSKVGKFLSECIQHWGYEILYNLNLHGVVSRHYIPPSTPSFVTPRHKTFARIFIPQKEITKSLALPKSSEQGTLAFRSHKPFAAKTKPLARGAPRNKPLLFFFEEERGKNKKTDLKIENTTKQSRHLSFWGH